MVQGKGEDRRASQRFAMDFKVSIHDVREGGLSFLEESVLHDVSGVGVSFLSKMPELYHAGQRLHISIILPGTDNLEARLEGNATVVRIGQAAATGVFVGVSMDDPLDFVSGAHRQVSSPGDSGHDA
ncbi:MAG TPA: PilZ domain-containing protein [Mariprofundaceae bacterium]|nr:PilZ domain-containing protein [Mariprofundaceae bacterium]